MKLSNLTISWIEDNYELINDGDLQKIFKKCPAEIVGEVLLAMDAVNAQVKEDPDSTEMWGIKSADGYTTMSLGKHNKTNFNVNYTSSDGMKGGMQIGFKSVCECIEFIKKLHIPENFRPSRMQPKIVNQYTWQEVDTIYGKCWITNLAFDKYDPTSAAKTRLLKKANKEAVIKIVEYLEPICKNIYDALESHFGIVVRIATYSTDPAVRVFDKYSDYHVELSITNFAIAEDDIPEVIKVIKSVSGLDVKVKHKYVSTYDNEEGWITNIWLDISSNKFYKDIRDEVYAKYGITP